MKLSEGRERFKIECCEDCKKNGKVEEDARIDFGEDGKQCGPHFLQNVDRAFVVEDASANARELVGTRVSPRQVLTLPGAGWVTGVYVRDIC